MRKRTILRRSDGKMRKIVATFCACKISGAVNIHVDSPRYMVG